MKWWPFKSKPAQPRPLWQPFILDPLGFSPPPPAPPRPPSGEPALVWPTIDSGLIPLKED